MALPVLSYVSVSLLHLCLSELTFLTHTPLPWHVWTLRGWTPDRQECQLEEKRVRYSHSTNEKISCTTFILILLQHPEFSPSVKWQALGVVAACVVCPMGNFDGNNCFFQPSPLPKMFARPSLSTTYQVPHNSNEGAYSPASAPF